MIKRIISVLCMIVIVSLVCSCDNTADDNIVTAVTTTKRTMQETTSVTTIDIPDVKITTISVDKTHIPEVCYDTDEVDADFTVLSDSDLIELLDDMLSNPVYYNNLRIRIAGYYDIDSYGYGYIVNTDADGHSYAIYLSSNIDDINVDSHIVVDGVFGYVRYDKDFSWELSVENVKVLAESET